MKRKLENKGVREVGGKESNHRANEDWSGKLGVFAVITALLLLSGVATVRAEDSQVVAARHANLAHAYADTNKSATHVLIETMTAAAQGDSVSQNTLADIYSDNSDYCNALKWYRLSAAQGNTNAQFSLAELLLSGHPVSSGSECAVSFDPGEAALWFGKLANIGHTQSQYELGRLYQSGVGVNQDVVEAFKWFSLAAKQGHGGAERGLQYITLKMRPEELIAAQHRFESFVPGRETTLPEPSYLAKLKLNGISGIGANRLVVINNHTMGVQEEAGIKLEDRTIEVRCIEIRDKSVVVEVGPFRKELQMANY